MDAMTIGVDLAKRVFQLTVANHHWHVQARYRFTRSQFERFLRNQPPARVVMEACGSAHFWARFARDCGHHVSILPAQYVRPYVRRNKTDRTDADALIEASRSGSIHPVAIKSIAQQELLGLHRIRTQWMATRTARINAVRGLLREHGLTIAPGARNALVALPGLLEDADIPLPLRLRHALALLYEEAQATQARIKALERELARIAADDPVIQRLMRIPGVGLLTATALVGSVGHIHAFPRARRFASWLGLTPREHSTGMRRRLGSISKQGDVYLRTLLTHGARAVLAAASRQAKTGRTLTRLQQWALQVHARRGQNKTAIAVANKLARIIWAVWSHDVEYCAAPGLPVAA